MIGGGGHRTQEISMVFLHRTVAHIFNIMHLGSSDVQFTIDHETGYMIHVIERLNLKINGSQMDLYQIFYLLPSPVPSVVPNLLSLRY
jgi:hypothetical protein